MEPKFSSRPGLKSAHSIGTG